MASAVQPERSGKPRPKDAEVESGFQAVEQYRTRARSVAALLAAIAGALLAGLNLQAVTSLPEPTRWSLLIATGLFSFGTAVAVVASLLDHPDPEFHEDTFEQEITALTTRIKKCVLKGLAAAGLGGVVIIAGTAYALAEPDDPAFVQLSSAGHAKAAVACPIIPPVIDTLRVDSVKGTDPLVSLRLGAGVCAPGSQETELVIPRADVATVLDR